MIVCTIAHFLLSEVLHVRWAKIHKKYYLWLLTAKFCSVSACKTTDAVNEKSPLGEGFLRSGRDSNPRPRA